MGHSIEINRAPALTLWAAVVPRRLGFDWEEALTLGCAVAGLNVYTKGKALGLFEPTPEAVKEKRRQLQREKGAFSIDLMNRKVPAVHTDAGMRQARKGNHLFATPVLEQTSPPQQAAKPVQSGLGF